MKFKHLFGPVMSRRLGVSLGVDVVPYKYCPLNCVYCEVQSTTHLSCKREEFFRTEEIIAELDNFLAKSPHLDYITFSGAGEPTLNCGLGKIVRHIKHNYPNYKLALLTNGVLLGDAQVRSEVLACDIVLPSLDSATQEGYERVNRPCTGLQVTELISGLVQFRKEYTGKIWLEVFFIPGVNDNEIELYALANAIEEIKPDLVQLNSLDRPGAEDWVTAMSAEELSKIRKYFSQRLSMPVEVIAKVKYNASANQMDEEITQLLQNTIMRRPSTAEDLSAMLDIHINEIGKVLRQLLLENKVTATREERGVFYTWIQK